VVLSALILTTGCDLFAKYKIRYEFTGTRSADVYYFNEDDDEVNTYATPPWSYEFGTSDETQSVGVDAFSLASGSATVRLFINDELKLTGSDGGSAGFNATTGVYKIKDLL
jgi:hypothetical protein